MSIMFKIHEGTSRLAEGNLCNSCRYSSIRVDNAGEHVRCSGSGGFMPEFPKGKVVSCNSYYNRTLPSLASFEEIAWELKTDKGGRVMGFNPPKPKD